ncbi:facilitated trehalose transporter Tret1-like [Tribolium madens]|uniref:facilitated trehalose transporter Tret1-like n=1 Tax=Tribolium madens TaxID=41895 RepID=UPI001CF7576B|nr:facilitated trehalose transporter Tret1-like [Tribolium madens]
MHLNHQTKTTSLYSLFKPGHLYQILACLSASLIVTSDGMQYGWSSPVIPILESKNSPVKITSVDSTWLETTFLLSGPLAIIITPLLVDKIGRHRLILIISCVSIIGWILIGVATRVEILYVARFLFGTTSDIIFSVVPMYTSEIADKEIRGLLNGFVYVLLYLGFILVYSIAPSTPFYVTSVVGVGILFLQIFTFLPMPESPYFLVKKQRYECALNSLKKFRSKNSCEIELEEITTYVNDSKSSVKEAIFKKSTLKVFVYLTILFGAQHFCGLSVILMNLYTILEEAGSIYLDPNTTEILFALLMLVSMCISCYVIDKFGRKNLLVLSCALTGVNLIGLAVYLHMKSLRFSVDYLSWLPLVFVMFYAVSFNIGLGLVPKVLVSELYPIKVKAIGMSVGGGIYEIAGTLSILFYKYCTKAYDMYIVFYFFGATAFVTVLITIFLIPETKGKSLEEIQVMLEGPNENA